MVEFSDVKAGLLEAWRTAGPVPAQGGLRGQAVGQAHQPPLSLYQNIVSKPEKHKYYFKGTVSRNFLLLVFS
jgi:hypothetical protein